MRVVLLTSYREACGIATYSESLVDGLRDEGAHVDVLAPKLPRGDAGSGEQPTRIWSRNRAPLREGFRLFRAIEERKPDVVHAQFNLSLFSSRVLFVLGELCARKRLPLVVTMHGRKGGLGRNFKFWRVLQGLRKADLVVHNDAHARELARDHVHVIPHGVDLPAPRDRGAARAILGIPPERPVLAHFGFLTPDKGIEQVMCAVAELRRSRTGGLPDLLYWICGGPVPYEKPDYSVQLRRCVSELGLEDGVRMAAEFAPDERARLELQAADWIFLNYQTGSNQGTSGAVRRVLSSGTPTAVTPIPLFDDVRDAVHTVRAPLVEEIARLFADAPYAASVAELSARYCRDNSWSRIARAHLAVYERALARRPL